MSDSNNSMIKDLTKGSVARKLFVFAYPFALSNILQLVYNLIDMMVIGQFVGSTGLSAVAVGGDLLNLCTHICIGFTSGGQIIIAQYVGRGDKKQVSRAIGTLFTSVLLFALALSVVMMFCCGWLLELMNTPPEALSRARSYSMVCFAGMFFIYGYNTVSAILRGMGDSKRPLLFIGIAAVINLILDLLFIAVFKMDTLGAALATVIGQAVSFASSLIYLYKRRTAFGFDFKPASFKIYPRAFKLLIKMGLPLALQHTAISISVMTVSSLANSFGVVASAVTGIGAKLLTAMTTFTGALRDSSSSMIGQNLGAGKVERVKKIVCTTQCATLAVFVVIGSIFYFFPEQVFSLFTDDMEVLAWAPKYMGACLICIFSFAMIAPYLALINGIGFAGMSLGLGLLDGVVARIGLSLLFGLTLGYGIVGFWYGNAFAGFFTAIPAGIYFLSGRWKRRELLIGGK